MNKCLISIGSNIDRTHHIRAAVRALGQQFAHLCCSPVYETEAVGFDGEAFYNLVVCGYTEATVAQVNDTLKHIEQQNGRRPSNEKFCPRTLDLDLLTFNDVVSTQPVVLPREEILHNAFVLQPLADLVPDDVHPVTGLTYQQLWHAFDASKQRLWPVAFNWSEV